LAHEILRGPRGGLSLASGRSRRCGFNQEEVHAVLPGSNEEAKSIKGIAQAMGLKISSYIDWVRAEAAIGPGLGRSDQDRKSVV
jgi:hypothetical protein